MTVLTLTNDPEVVPTLGVEGQLGDYNGTLYIHLTSGEDTNWCNLSALKFAKMFRWLLWSEVGGGGYLPALDRVEDYNNGFGGAISLDRPTVGRRLLVSTDKTDFGPWSAAAPRYLDLSDVRQFLGSRATGGLRVRGSLAGIANNDQIQIPNMSGGFNVLEIHRSNPYTPTPDAIQIDATTWGNGADALRDIGAAILAFGWEPSSLHSGANGDGDWMYCCMVAPRVGADYNGATGYNPWVIVCPGGGITWKQPTGGTHGLGRIEGSGGTDYNPTGDLRTLLQIITQGPDRVLMDTDFGVPTPVSYVELSPLEPDRRYRIIVRTDDANGEARYIQLQPPEGNYQGYYVSGAGIFPANLQIGRGDSVTPPQGTGILEPSSAGNRDFQAFGQKFGMTLGCQFLAAGGANTSIAVGWRIVFGNDGGTVTMSGHIRVVEEHGVPL